MYQPNQASNGLSPFGQGGGTAPNTNNNTTTSSAAAAAATEDEEDLDAPLFRSVAVQPHFNASFNKKKNPFALKKPSTQFGQVQGSTRSSFQFTGAAFKPSEPKSASPQGAESVLKKWKALAQDQMYVLPPYYPRCERRSATTKHDVEDLLDRLFSCFKKLSIQARHESSFATFGLVLRTSEQSELSLLIWYANKARTTLYVEVDKRQSSGGVGGSFPFQYICRILKVVKSTKEDMSSSNDSVSLPAHRELQAGNNAKADRCRKMGLLVDACAPQSPRLEEMGFPKAPAASMPSFSTVGDQTLSSLEMAWGLLKKPVTWSHGLELLGTVSDPDKSGIESSKVASKAILLGSAPSPHGDTCCRGIHKKLVGLMQSLVGDATDEEISTEHMSTYQKDCLLQLVLTCLVNAMEVHVKFVKDGLNMDMTMMTEGTSVMSQFLESTKDVVACDIIETLMDIMRRANTKPHHAYLAVKALFLLSSENSSMRQCVSMAMSRKDSQCEALQEAHEVGAQTHGLLEAECERLQRLFSTRH